MSVRLCLKLSGQCADPEIVRENFNKIMRFLCEFVVTCVPVEMQSGSEDATPDGVIDVPYNYTVHLIGTQPFEIHDIVAPAWMTVTLNEDDITFSGTPDILGTDLGISFFVTNCTSDQINFGAFIDVLDGTGSGSGDTGSSAWVERFTNGGGDMLSVVDLLDPSVQTVFLKATTDDTIVLIPNPKIFADATEVTNTLWIVRADPDNDPELNVVVLVSDGTEGTIEGDPGFILAPGQTIMFQSNGEEYKILFDSLSGSATVISDEITITGDGSSGNKLKALYSDTIRFVADNPIGVNGPVFGGLEINTNVFCESTIGEIVVDLPPAKTFAEFPNFEKNNPFIMVYGDGGGNPKSIQADGGAGTINGSVTPITLANEESYTFQSDGIEWKIINHYIP